MRLFPPRLSPAKVCAMTPALEQLVRDAMEATGSDKPELFDDNAPVLDGAALAGQGGEPYFVGLIGGKDVGKSALINAIVGQPITAVTSHGVGTEIAIAYAHVSLQPWLKEMLDREVPGNYRIVTHELNQLRRQVLLDLPDIDSRYMMHLQVTRTMLRHMLYPVWVGSVEKYADAQPQQMLARVAEGNTPGNFVFVMNKVDQLKGYEVRDGISLADRPIEASAKVGGTSQPLSNFEQLRADYMARLQKTLQLPEPPRVYMIAARHPNFFELPALCALLTQQKTEEEVREARRQAVARQDKALRDWLEAQELSIRAERLARLAAECAGTHHRQGGRAGASAYRAPAAG